MDLAHLHNLRDWALCWFEVHEFATDDQRRRQYTPPPRPASAPPADPYAVLHLLPTAPAELVRAAYRVMAQLHHPDKGGDDLTMKRINNAFEALTKGAA